MKARRVTILVEVNCDGVIGTFYEPKDHVDLLINQWAIQFPWYCPTVKFLGVRDVNRTSENTFEEITE